MLSASFAWKVTSSSSSRLIVAGQLREESGRRQLPLVTDDDHLPASRHRAERIHGLDLRRLVDDQQIERDRPRLQELSHRERAHQEDRLDLLDDGASPFQQLPYRQMISLLGDLSVQHAQWADSAHCAAAAMHARERSGRARASCAP